MPSRMLRRGLPRVAGGDPWPPAVEVEDAAAKDEASPTSRHSALRVRRGLPRVPGGEPWPPAEATAAPANVSPSPAPAEASARPEAPTAPAATVPTAAPIAAAPSAGAAPAPGAAASAVRRGLPRVAGGDPWPPAGTLPTAAVSSEGPSSGSGAEVEVGSGTEITTLPAARTSVLAADIDTPLRGARTVWNGRAPRHLPAAPAPASARRRPTWPQAIAALMGAAALGVLAGAAIAFVRALLSFPFMQDFLAAFPGEYEPAIAVAPGFAPWVGWQHFFNVFLMVLIIRSGLRVRSEKRPTVFWSPRNNPKGKISLTLWFHQALDILWLVNGVIFVVLLIVTGHWVRIVPTSWEVFPNALSAALQYVSFDWPHENGWNNYNSLQQLAYFTTVFLAAPLAAITGFRMSGMWPKKAERLSKAYPVEWARALHFPVMLYFVVFIIAHVALVMLTGFLRNLNHMYASQDAVTWTGFWVFVASLVVIAGAWFAARPLVLAPIAKTMGTVSGR
ncbi:cytochrome b/b6 domain-containing protein [Microbacterium sp. SSW1-49]|uniref:Cytochrome b/b6 domain-containing protein n=1 Tax=Microbacterium croceum TaxID=2851645 RepID=A0ABT0F933_9MICO|nr:cytochrome b/b6 domain-containing protein [Microbacterium croceum]MCK2034551.1 cytochrome b/b6 domain-containing protein [Microbacterium croceum]